MNVHAAIAELAASQDGLVTTAQLRASGVSKWTQQRLVAEGRIHRIAPRVYALNGAANTHRQRLRAGLLALGDRSWVSYEAAAALHGLDRSDRCVVEFSIDRGRRLGVLPFVVHTSTRLDPVDLVVIRGLRATSATRTIFDLALGGAVPERIEAAIDSAVRLQLSSPEALRRRLTDLRGSGRWGCRLIEDTLTDGGRTTVERRFLALVRELGLPRPRADVVLRRNGRHIARVDFVFESRAMVVEVSDGQDHRGPRELARDAQRRNELRALGRRVHAYTWHDVTERPAMVCRTLLGLVA